MGQRQGFPSRRAASALAGAFLLIGSLVAGRSQGAERISQRLLSDVVDLYMHENWMYARGCPNVALPPARKHLMEL
jgi:hypothetical protein